MIDPAYVRKNFPPIRPDWLAEAREPVLEPGLPVIDTHHHLWDLPEGTYLRPELQEDLASGHDVRATVFVDCHSKYRAAGPEALQPVGETEFVVEEVPLDASNPRNACAAIVSWADLMLGDAVEETLAAHVQAGQGRFRGIRTRSAWHAHPEVHPVGLAQQGMLVNPALQKGARRLGAMGLTLDVWVYHSQLEDVARLARACPGTTIILDHCGAPLGIGPYEDQRDEVFRAWSEQIRAIAQHENVVVKLGGLAMPRMGWRFHERATPVGSAELAQQWEPYVSTCVEAFGAHRAMFESNFPVDKGACSYRVVWNAFKRLAAGCSSTEKHALFAATAARVYRIEEALNAS
jgi:predicted TIM-barrel fold metal-dependent hydrolase